GLTPSDRAFRRYGGCHRWLSLAAVDRNASGDAMIGGARRLALAGLWSLAGCGGAALDAVGLPPRALADGLVAHFAFDEGAGMLAKDGSGNGRDGQVTGGTWIADARFAGGLRLDRGDSIT